ncbi:multicopper oxidase family protein [Xanthobacteraceae bacterium A53D]
MHIPVLSRRAALAGAAALLAGSALPRLGHAQTPPAQPTPTPAGTLLRAGDSERMVLAGPDPVALFDKALPGPVLRVKRGQPMSVTVANDLAVPLDITWHGIRLPNALDGVPGLTGPSIARGETRDIRIAPPDAGTFWYHAFDASLTRRALAGALIVEEDSPPAYGADHVMLIQTWGADPTTQIPLITVNGRLAVTLEAPAASRARLRLINASPDFLRLKVMDAPCWAIAIDGRPMAPIALKDGRLMLVPGGRIDIALDVNLDGGTPDPIQIQALVPQGPVQLALIAPVGGSTAPAPTSAPAPLPANDALPANIPLQGAVRAEMTITDRDAEPGNYPVLATLAAQKTAVFSLANKTEAPVAVQFYGMPVRQLDGMDDGWKPWWHDTLMVAGNQTLRVAVRPDTPGKWAIIARRAGTGTIAAAACYVVT